VPPSKREKELRKSILGAAPDCRRRPNPKQSIRKKEWWALTKKKLAEYEKLIRIGFD
jgi:hypothetical protein